MSVASSSASVASDGTVRQRATRRTRISIFRHWASALWRKRWQILIPTILGGAWRAISPFSSSRRNISPKRASSSRAASNVYLRPDADKITTDPTIDAEAVTSQAQIILSRDLALEVINKLKLGELPEFDSTLNGVSPLKALLGLLGLGKDPLSMTHEERVLNAYYDRLSVSPLEKSRIINIDFLSEDPELAARVANAIADAYLVRQRQAKQEQAQSAGQWLAGQIETMRQKVEAAEAKVEDFRAKANLLVGINNTTLSAQTLGDVNAQLAAARALKTDAEAKAKLIRDMLKSGQPIESSDFLNSELIRRLTEQRITLRAQLAEQSSTLLDNHPRIKELRAQIADLDGQIRSEAEKIARSFENDAKLAGARLQSQSATLDQLKNQAASTNGQDVQLRGARARRQIAARSSGILSRQISRGDLARHDQFDAGRRPHRFARHGVEYSGLSEETADHPDRDLRHAGDELGSGDHQGNSRERPAASCRCAASRLWSRKRWCRAARAERGFGLAAERAAHPGRNPDRRRRRRRL